MQKIFISFFSITLLFLTACGKEMFTFPSTRDVPVDVNERVEKNIEEGRGVSFGMGNSGQGGVFDFASSNEMWRASIEVLDFVSFTNASYSGGIIITDWFSGNSDEQNSNLRELKITVRFLSNEIRADGLKVIVHEKLCEANNKGDCQIQKIESEITNQIKLAILKKASIYKKEDDIRASKDIKKRRKTGKNKKLGKQKTPKDYN